MEFLGHEEEGWYSGQLKGQTGVFPSNFVEELSSPGSVSSAPTTDGKQLSSAPQYILSLHAQVNM